MNEQQLESFTLALNGLREALTLLSETAEQIKALEERQLGVLSGMAKDLESMKDLYVKRTKEEKVAEEETKREEGRKKSILCFDSPIQ